MLTTLAAGAQWVSRSQLGQRVLRSRTWLYACNRRCPVLRVSELVGNLACAVVARSHSLPVNPLFLAGLGVAEFACSLTCVQSVSVQSLTTPLRKLLRIIGILTIIIATATTAGLPSWFLFAYAVLRLVIMAAHKWLKDIIAIAPDPSADPEARVMYGTVFLSHAMTVAMSLLALYSVAEGAFMTGISPFVTLAWIHWQCKEWKLL